MLTPEQILKQYWGFDVFRPLQRDIIESVLQGRDTLALLPTGGGKSICFQVPSLLKNLQNQAATEGGANGGLCLVVSPLIALMKDQVENLNKRNIAAAAIFSGMNYGDLDRILDNAVFGHYQFLYLSPERLKTEMAIERIKRMKINLLAIDEAHCISQWGYDFRPPYLQIAEIRAYLPNVPILALTATATPEVINDIQEKLHFKANAQVFQQSFERKNLSYIVRHVEDKPLKMLEIFRKMPEGAGIVYVRNRRQTKELANFLSQNGIAADFYHAGLDPTERGRKQDAWINDQIKVIVATNAFGMGIDKPNVRVVVHIDLPDNLEAYFQEAGRAGRDGKKSYCVLLYQQTDRIHLAHHYKLAYPEISDIRKIYHALGVYFQLATGSGEGESFDFDLIDFCQRFRFDPLGTLSALKVLEQDGWFTYSENIFIPSQLTILLGREQLYDFLLKYPQAERVLKGLLRLIGGIMNNHLNFNEQQLANFLKMAVSDLEKTLKWLATEGVVTYRLRKDKPQLTWLLPRQDRKDLSIDRALYEFRRKRHEFRLKRALEYAEMPICRSKQLLHYFGQVDATACGACDVCLERKNELSAEELTRLSEKIRLLLRHETLTLQEIAEAFAEKNREKMIRVVEFMLDNQQISKTNGKFFLKK